MKNLFLILIIIIASQSCKDIGEEEKKTLKCDVFDFESGVNIHSKNKIDSSGTVIRYKKNSNEAVDTVNVVVENNSKYQRNNYFISYRPLNTGYDYQVILNDTLRFFITDIESEIVSHGMDFAQGTRYMCDIKTYKINGRLKTESQLYIDLAMTNEDN